MTFLRSRRATIPAVPLVMRVAAVALALVAAYGPRVGDAPGVRRVVVIDHSASANPEWLQVDELLRDLGGGDEVCVVEFGANTVAGECGAAELPLRDASSQIRRTPSPTVDPHASDLAAALRHAATLSPADRRRFEVLVATDRRVTSTEADLVDAALALRGANCVELRFIDVSSRTLPPRIAELRGPGWAQVGEVFSLVATGDGGPRGGRLSLVRGGQPIDARDVPAGPFRVAFSARSLVSGETAYEVQFAAHPGQPAARSNVVISAPRSALVMVPAAAPEPTARALRSALGSDVEVRRMGEAGLERALAAHDVVVIVGTAPTMGERALLAEWAAADGGLVLVGDVRWDAISPLRTTPPDDSGVFLYLALDGSGSMSEAWQGSDGRTRDSVVRSAARELAAAAPAEVTVALRRFSDRLLPDGGGPWLGRPGATERDEFDGAVDRLAAPAGGTLLAPALFEAATMAKQRPERARRALVFTDGRVGDEQAVLRDALGALAESECGLTLVVDHAEGAAELRGLVAGTDVDVLYVHEAALLGGVLQGAADRATASAAVHEDVALRAGAGAAALPGLKFPQRVVAVVRRWSTSDATVVVESDAGDPVAAIRRLGLGAVAALTALPDLAGIGGGWPDSSDALWLPALRGAVESRSSDVRVAQEGGLLLVRPGSGTRPASVSVATPGGAASASIPLVPGEGGLLVAHLSREMEASVVVLRDAAGHRLRSLGLDRPAPPEYHDPGEYPVETLRALAEAAPARRGRSLRPWLAALSVLLVVVAHWIAARQLSSRPRDLPM